MRFKIFFTGMLLTVTASATQAADLANGIYTIQQQSSGRFLDAHDASENDFAAVTREGQGNRTQEWFIYKEGTDTYRIKQMFSGQFLDSHPSGDEANRVVKRAQANKDSQRWTISGTPGSGYVLTQVSSGQKLDAHEHEERDFAVVTRPVQGNTTQSWDIKVAASSKAMLKKFREGALCHRFHCGEFRNTDYSNKERAVAAAAAACNAGPHDIELVFRRKQLGNWETIERLNIEAGECRGYSSSRPLLSRREIEIRVNDPKGSVYHLMRSFDETLGIINGSPEFEFGQGDF